MIHSFDTSSLSTESGSKGGGLLTLLLVAAAVGAGLYFFVIKPEMEKEKNAHS